jgi:hypothetical protein
VKVVAIVVAGVFGNGAEALDCLVARIGIEEVRVPFTESDRIMGHPYLPACVPLDE